REGRTIATAIRISGSYVLSTLEHSPERAFQAASPAKASETTGSPSASTSANTWHLWHRRFAHIGKEKLLGLFKATNALKEPLNPADLGPCEPCTYSKQLRIVNRVPPQRASQPLGRVYSDYWGPYWVPTIGGYRYFLSFTDDA